MTLSLPCDNPCLLFDKPYFLCYINLLYKITKSMTSNSLITSFKTHYKIILLIAVLVMVIGLVFSIVVPAKYKSTTQILVTQNYGANTDIYAAAKFTEYLSNLLNEVIYSDSFYNQVMTSGFSIVNDFDQRAEKRKKQWENIVQSKVLSDTGIIVINVYHPNRNQADELSRAIAFIMTDKSGMYHGAGDQVSVRVIDGPVTTLKTVKPNITLNVLASLILGLILGGLFVYLFPGLTEGYQFKPGSKTPDQRPETETVQSSYNQPETYHQPLVTSIPADRSNDIKPMTESVMTTKTLQQHWGLE